MFNPHRGCVELRTSLLARISDLERQITDMVGDMYEQQAAASKREAELVDRLIALTNPMAARMMVTARSSSPAPPLPRIPRDNGGGSVSPPRRGPALTPASSGFRPLMEEVETPDAERDAG